MVRTRNHVEQVLRTPHFESYSSSAIFGKAGSTALTQWNSRSSLMCELSIISASHQPMQELLTFALIKFLIRNSIRPAYHDDTIVLVTTWSFWVTAVITLQVLILYSNTGRILAHNSLKSIFVLGLLRFQIWLKVAKADLALLMRRSHHWQKLHFLSIQTDQWLWYSLISSPCW